MTTLIIKENMDKTLAELSNIDLESCKDILSNSITKYKPLYDFQRLGIIYLSDMLLKSSNEVLRICILGIIKLKNFKN